MDEAAAIVAAGTGSTRERRRIREAIDPLTDAGRLVLWEASTTETRDHNLVCLDAAAAVLWRAALAAGRRPHGRR